MNSIEFLELELHEFLRQNQKKIDKGTINPLTVQFMIDEFTNAINELKVLEMLRPHLINAGIGMFDNVEDNEIFHLKLTLNGEEYNKLKECLEDKDEQY